jgi:DNA polymerase I
MQTGLGRNPHTNPRMYGGIVFSNRPAPDNIARMDHNAMRAVVEMRKNGIAVDVGALRGLGAQCAREMEDLAGQIEGLVGVKVNPGSGKQVADLLFRKLQLGVGAEKKMTRSGAWESTNAIDIEPYLHQHAVVPLIYKWRERQKIQTTYCEPLVEMARQDRHGNWLVRTEILWTRTGTGRYASKNPNLQNIPVRTALGVEVRNAFIARKINGRRMKLVTVDQSQIEMRVAAHVSGARKMIDIFHLPEFGPDGKPNKMADLHIRTAMAVFKIPAEQVHKLKHRYPMKRAGFGILYLITAAGLVLQLNNPEAQDPAAPHVWSEDEVQTLIDAWYGEYDEIREMQELAFWQVMRYGMCWDMFGRTREVPEVKSGLPWVVEAGKRQAANMGIQSGAGGTLKIAMAYVADEFSKIRAMGLHCAELMTIHDEVLSEAEPEIVEGVGKLVGWAMENSAPLRVPIRWGMGVGDRWGELEK